MISNRISQEVTNALNALGLSDVEKLTPEVSSVIINKVINHFTVDKKYYYPLWENMINTRSKRYEYAWEFFEEILKEKQVILFFDQADDKNMFAFRNGGVLTKVFENCFGFIFYITDPNFTFLLAYNDHDYLIGSGDIAVKWVENIQMGLD